MAYIITKAGTDQTLVLDVREALIYPFNAPNWTDLRMSAWLSLTTAAADDVSPGQGVGTPNVNIENLPISTVKDRAWIGFKNAGNLFPNTAGSLFVGLGSEGGGDGSGLTVSTLRNVSPSIIDLFNFFASYVYDGTTAVLNRGSAGTNDCAFPGATPTGYAIAYVVRMARPTAAALTIDVGFYAARVSGVFTNTPDVNPLRTFTTTNLPSMHTGSSGSHYTVSAVPTCLFFYWPFFNSRLRIHALVLEKYS